MTERKIAMGCVAIGIIAFAVIYMAVNAGPPVRVTKVLTASGTRAGVMTDAACRSIPKHLSWQDAISRYGWPQPIPASERVLYGANSYEQQSNGGELDYPIGTTATKSFTRECGLIFVRARGPLDHVWQDLP